jgi:predicted nucleotidyltransferase
VINFEQLKPRILALVSEDDSIDALWLYGSFAKGNASEHSDIDLAVIFKEKEPDILERRLRPEVLALEWQEALGLSEGQLSVLDMESGPIPLAMGVLRTGQLLINKNPTREFFVSRKIMSVWELDYQHHYKVYGT